MAQTLYVYIPGFEYNSKGPLHIDAIHLNVTIGQLDSSKQSSLLLTYCLVSPDIEGDVVYRTCGSVKKDTLNMDSSVRCAYGCFYDFVTDTSDKTHHVIGIYKNPETCAISVRNFDVNNHDGLFIVKLDLLNTDLILNFTFYSRIDNADVDNPIVGTLETNINNHFRDNNFYDKYIEVGKWTQTYNPATSGLKEGVLKLANPVQLYFDLKLPESATWEIPVNAGLLVSKMRGDENKVLIAGDYSIWKLYTYDSSTRKHILDNNLRCNNPISSFDFYNNFYQKSSTISSVVFSTEGTGVDASGNSLNAHIFGDPEWGALRTLLLGLLAKERTFLGKYLYQSTLSGKRKYSYNLCYVDLSRFSYLYSIKPYIHVENLAHANNFGNTFNNHSLVVSVDTISNSTKGTEFRPYIPAVVTDLYNLFVGDNFDNAAAGLFYTSTDAHKSKMLSDIKNGIDYNATLNLIYTESLPTKSTSTLLTPTLQLHHSKDINTGADNLNINQKDSLYKYLNAKNNNVSYFYKKWSGNLSNNNILQGTNYVNGFSRGVYLGTVGNENSLNTVSFTTPSFLGSSNIDVSLDTSAINKVELNFTLSGVLFPVLTYAVEKPANLFLTLNSAKKWIDRPEIKKFYTWRRDLDASVVSDDSVYNEPYYYNHSKFMRDTNFGQVCVCIPLMFLIDLLKSAITYNNTSEHTIVPMLYYEENLKGYEFGKESLLDVNVEHLNLLDPNPQETESFEFNRVLSKLTSSDITLSECFNLPLSDSRLIDSTFCKDNRFLGYKNFSTSSVFNTLTDNIEATFTNFNITLTSGLYLLRILDLRQLEHLILFTIGTLSNTSYIKGLHNRWLFYVKENLTAILTIPKILFEMAKKVSTGSRGRSYRAYNVISGIGLYKVNLAKLDSNTVILNGNVKNYIDTINENAFMIPTDQEDIYNKVILPAVYCAKEEVNFCSKRTDLDSSEVNIDYGNSYDDGAIHHYYNFSYLPEIAFLEVAAFYKIPITGSKATYITTVIPGLTKTDMIKNTVIRL